MKKFCMVFLRTSSEKYWMPKPFIKPHSDAEALNEETAEILEKEDDTNDEAAVETLLHDDSEAEKQKEVE